jgi:hypothetical protein
MRSEKQLSAIVIPLSLLVLILSTNTGWANSAKGLDLDPTQVSWSALSYEGKGSKAKMKSSIRLAPYSSEEFKALWQANPKSLPLPAAEEQGYRLEVRANVDLPLTPTVKLTDQTWFDPKEAKALYRIRERRGKDDFKNTYWFTREGVHRYHLEPKSRSEASKKPEQWTVKKTSLYGFDLNELGCQQVSESSLLAYMVSAYFTDKNKEPLSVCVFGRRQLHQVQMEVAGVQSVTVDYNENKGGTKAGKKGAIEVLRVRLTTKPLKSTLKSPEEFSFLGLEKNISIDLENKSGVPVQVNGDVPKAGTVNLKLNAVTLCD